MSKKLFGLLLFAALVFSVSCQDNSKKNRRQNYRFDKRSKRSKRGCPDNDRECCDMHSQKNEVSQDSKILSEDTEEKKLPMDEIKETVDNSSEVKEIFEEEDKFEFNNN